MNAINWKPIIKLATDAATELGHVVNGFDSPEAIQPRHSYGALRNVLRMLLGGAEWRF